MKKRILYLFAVLIAVSVSLVIFTACKNDDGKKKGDDVNTELGYTPTPAFDPDNVRLNAEGKEYDELDTSTMNANPFNLPWWDNFPRFTNYGTYQKADGILANVTTTISAFNDEGRTALMRDIEYNNQKAMINLMQISEIYPGGWMECMGSIDCIIAAFRMNEDGAFVTDENTGRTKMYAMNWTWDSAGFNNPEGANYVNWLSVDTYLNRLPFYGNYLDNMTLSEPTYPDGTSALGYFNSEEDPRPNNAALSGGYNGSWPADPEAVFAKGDLDPRNAKLYDAMCGKDINGKMWYNIGLKDSNAVEYKIHYFSSEGVEQWAGSMGFYKDVTGKAGEWWVEYYNESFEDAIRKGCRFFWIDNYNGYDYSSYETIRNGFGEYSVVDFKAYLAEHQDAAEKAPTDLDSTPYIVNGVNTINPKDPDNFDIRSYMKALFSKIHPDMDPNTDIYESGMLRCWQDPTFLDDSIWNAYFSFKNDQAMIYAKLFHDAMKAAAVRAGVNPDEVAIGGNDIARLDMGGLDGTEFEMIHTEYTPMYSIYNGSNADGLPPYGSSAPFYKVIAEHQISRHGVVWFYSDGMPDDYKYAYELAVVAGMDALANNSMLNWGNDLHVMSTDRAARTVHKYMANLTPVLSGRVRAGSIALFYSYDSLSGYTAPYNIANIGPIEPSLAFYGFAHAFEEANIPYDVIFDFKKASLEKLDDIKLLIIPSVTAINDETINVLVDYVNNGGCVLYTGYHKDERNGRTGGMQWRGEAKLLNEMKKLESTGRVFFGDDEYPMEYLKMKNKDFESTVDQIMPSIKAMLDQFKGNGIEVEYKLDYKGRIRSSLMQNFYNDSISIDLVNFDLEIETDTLTDSEGAKVSFKPFGVLDGAEKLKVICYGIDGKGVYCDAVKGEDGYFTFDVPAFRNYVTIVIKKA